MLSLIIIPFVPINFQGAIAGVAQVGGDMVSATKNSVMPAFDASKEISEEVANSVKNALKESVDGAKDIFDEIR